MRLTDEDKEHIAELRAAGDSYQQISDKLGLSINTVKSYINRHGLRKNTMYVYCLQCGAELHQVPKTKRKKFCNDNCRAAWWSAHPDRINRKKVKRSCLYCGKEFEANESSTKKYCSTDCYFKDRFKDYTPKAHGHDRSTAFSGEKHTAMPDGCLCASCAWFYDGKRHCSGCETADDNL